jgi:hypothetical protein
VLVNGAAGVNAPVLGDGANRASLSGGWPAADAAEIPDTTAMEAAIAARSIVTMSPLQKRRAFVVTRYLCNDYSWVIAFAATSIVDQLYQLTRGRLYYPSGGSGFSPSARRFAA